MANIYEVYPELICLHNGDPYWAEIIKIDDIICDHRYNYEWLGLEEAEAAVIAERAERWLLSYELAALYAWWAMTKP